MEIQERGRSGHDMLRSSRTGDLLCSSGTEWSRNHFRMEFVPSKLLLLRLYQSPAAPIRFLCGAPDCNDSKMCRS
jgi:hypothetical protein